ncbi:hypothetical protein ABPG77_003968 [Micractinium sp. CCAP 211/92]
MTSKAEAALTFKGFGSKLVPSEVTGPGVNVQLKKRAEDFLLTLAFNDATLRDPKAANGLVLSAERKLGSGVKGTLAYIPAANDALATLQVDKRVNDSDLTLKAAYQLRGDVFTVEETWKFDPQNKLVGKYNFAKEELVFSYEHTRGSLKLGAQYNLKTEKPLLSAEKKEGKHTLAAIYSPKDDAATLSWQLKPAKLVLSGKTGRRGFTDVTAKLLVTHEFEI